MTRPTWPVDQAPNWPGKTRSRRGCKPVDFYFFLFFFTKTMSFWFFFFKNDPTNLVTLSKPRSWIGLDLKTMVWCPSSFFYIECSLFYYYYYYSCVKKIYYSNLWYYVFDSNPEFRSGYFNNFLKQNPILSDIFLCFLARNGAPKKKQIRGGYFTQFTRLTSPLSRYFFRTVYPFKLS